MFLVEFLSNYLYDYFMKNNLKQKLLQLFIVGYEGETPSENIFSLLENGLGGIIFFSENLKTRKEFSKTINKIKSSAKIPPFLSIDQEGGLVERTIFLDERIEYLTPKALSPLDKQDIKTHYDILAKDLVSLGINLNFAPVIDVNSNPKNPVIGIRSFGNNAKIVSDNAKIVTDCFRENSILSCAKHYPGHGGTNTDSHQVMPRVDIDFDKFCKTHLVTFKKAIENNVDTIMVSHIHFPFFDEVPTPASLSKNAINYLKKELNFKGIIFSDDMVMGGISKNYGLKESIILALKAGIDALIFRNITDELVIAIEEISNTEDAELIQCIKNAYEKILKFKQKNLKPQKTDNFSVQNGQNIINKIALKTPVIVKDENFLPINPGDTTILSFDNKEIYNLSTTGSLSDFITAAKEINYPVDPTCEDVEKIIKQINNDNKVIFISYNSVLHPNQEKLFNMIKNKKAFISVGEYNPQTINAGCIIELNSAKTPSLRALAKVLCKK